ncbi:MAG TPA: outer membrane beta-barrel protein [Candidatus Baltobacteraceae bacterium]|jgi:hypothetical protein
MSPATRRVPIVLATLFLLSAPALAQTQPRPSASPSPVPAVTWQTDIAGYLFNTTNPNAAGTLDTPDGRDSGSRVDTANVMTTVTRNAGVFRFAATIGGYAFPVVGQAINPTFAKSSNTNVFGYVPVSYVQYVPNGAWTFTVGKMPALLGQESNFTYQNVNIQRGLAWNAEPTFTRGVRAQYARGKFAGTLGYTDGYYSGRFDTVEGLAVWAPSSNTTLQFAFIAPQASLGPNPTAGIANKREANFMLTQQFGKLTLAAYLLWIDSPGDKNIGFSGDERAFAGVLIANYAFDGAWSLGARYESLANRSGVLDTGANADLVSFGPGSTATTITLTPAYKSGHTTVRGEYSSVILGTFTPGAGFGPAGNGGSQSRLGIEIGVQF